MPPDESNSVRPALASDRNARVAGHLLAVAIGTGGLIAATQAADPADACSARSGTTPAPVVELYTSEGCSSCPPADRWLSRLTAQPDVVALAFHVDYWDHLGWKDPFGSAVHTERQFQQQAVNGARFSYTPQVAINGIDSRQWPRLRPPLAGPAIASTVQVRLSRDGDLYTAVIQPVAGAPARLAAYWAITENQHVSSVHAGENQGATLAHDFVVREYLPVPAWATANENPRTLSFRPAPSSRSTAHPRQVNLVVVDAASGRPLQALKLGC